MATARRKRGRPRKEPRELAPARVALELPAVVSPVGDDEPDNVDAALAALKGANPDAPAPGADSPPTPALETPPLSASAPAPLPSSSSNGTNGHAPPAPPKPRDPRDRTVTWKQYAKLDRKQLADRLAQSTNRVTELETQLKTALPAAVAAKAAALETMCGVVISAVFDLAGLATGYVDEMRLEREEERELGELGAPALAPYLGEYAKHAPLFAFGAKLTTVITTKALAVKAAQAAKDDE